MEIAQKELTAHITTKTIHPKSEEEHNRPKEIQGHNHRRKVTSLAGTMQLEIAQEEKIASSATPDLTKEALLSLIIGTAHQALTRAAEKAKGRERETEKANRRTKANLKTNPNPKRLQRSPQKEPKRYALTSQLKRVARMATIVQTVNIFRTMPW